MYHPATFNSRGFFQRLGGWLGAKPSAAVQSRATLLLQRSHRTLFHLDQCDQLGRLAHEQFASVSRHLPPVTGDIQGASPLVTAVIVELSAAITSLRIAQNEAWQLICAANGSTSAPSSIHDGYNAIARKRSAGTKSPKWMAAIPSEARRLVMSYWEGSGQALTAHRDVDQHHTVVATGCFLRLEEGHVRDVSIVLPDNPEAKTPTAFVYSRKVSGVAFVREAFAAFHEFVERIAEQHTTATAPLGLNFTPAPEIMHAEDVERPTALVLFDYSGGRGILLGQTADRRVSVTTVPLESTLNSGQLGRE